jgi:hypothetical protein
MHLELFHFPKITMGKTNSIMMSTSTQKTLANLENINKYARPSCDELVCEESFTSFEQVLV